MSLLSTIQSARSGLQSASTAIETTAHNVANVSTEGFHRRRVERGQHEQINRKGVHIGQGVFVNRVRRATDELLGVRMFEQMGISQKSKYTSKSLQQIESAFNEAESSGIAETLDEFFDALSRATADPSDSGLRASVVRKGEIFARAVNRTSDSLSNAMSDFESDMSEMMDNVNSIAKNLAQINTSINASGDSLGAGDMLDSRDNLVSQLAKEVGGQVDYAPNGTATVFVAGHAIVSGISHREMSLGTNSSGEPVIQMAVDSGNVVMTNNMLGKMGGLVQARNLVKDYLSTLDTFASDFADSVNTQHALGFDLTGSAGGSVFGYTTTSASPGQASSTLEFDSTLLDDPNGLAFSGSATGGVGNDDNLKSLVDIQAANLFNSGTTTTGEFAADLIAEVGNDIAKFNGLSSAEGEHLSDLEGMMESLTGVNLDQEATDLIEFQAAYQAAAKVIRAANSLIDYMIETLG